MIQDSFFENIYDYANLNRALKHCRKGKQNSAAYQRLLLDMPDVFIEMSRDLRSAEYPWMPYNEIMVCDPKKRVILVAPFKDRVAQQAICQIIAPRLESTLLNNSFACRKNMGNQKAVITLHNILKNIGSQRYAVKLDIRKYFASIDHEILRQMLKGLFQEDKLLSLLNGLIGSHHEFSLNQCGIPIGNVSSQYFANLYLSPVDRFAAKSEDVQYIRYMDDMVLVGKSKSKVKAMMHELYDIIATLKLSVPPEKKVSLGKDPIPFLGFVVDHAGVRIQSQNRRRFQRRIRRLKKKNIAPSKIAQQETSFFAWSRLTISCQ